MRASDAERDRVADLLRSAVVAGSLSHETYLRRLDGLFVTRDAAALQLLAADLPPAASAPPAGGRLTRLLTRGMTQVWALRTALLTAWRVPRLPVLALPPSGASPLRIGRDEQNGLRLGHSSVSRFHAELCSAADGWYLRDLRSRNGTYVNGQRVTGTVVVGSADWVAFGGVGFRLAS